MRTTHKNVMSDCLRITAITLAIVASITEARAADLKLPAVFSDKMVLQRDQANSIWGWAAPGAEVRVTVKRDEPIGPTSVTLTGDDGRWQTALPKLTVGKPCRVEVIAGFDTIEIKDVMVGEVWIASGQSNMAMTVARSKDAESEIESANDPQLRMFTLVRRASQEPLDDCQGKWAAATPQTVGSFSATAYFFARKLRQELQVPIGIVHASWGGTAVEAWTSQPALEAIPEGNVLIGEWQQQAANGDATKVKANQNYPGNLFRGMIHPIVGYGARGAIWYQGERNSRNHAGFYGTLLRTLIADWRDRWKQDRLDFYWVQLPNYQQSQQAPSETSGWVLVREGMLQTLSVPHTGMAITTDVGEARDIHPKNKQDVGLRLAFAALAQTYGLDIVASGPVYSAAETVTRDGKKYLAISFRHLGEGLKPASGTELKGFAVAGADKQWKWADAHIEGDRVLVGHVDIAVPVACRYAWAANPIGNLVNSSGLPASPFRTDDWEN